VSGRPLWCWWTAAGCAPPRCGSRSTADTGAPPPYRSPEPVGHRGRSAPLLGRLRRSAPGLPVRTTGRRCRASAGLLGGAAGRGRTAHGVPGVAVHARRGVAQRGGTVRLAEAERVVHLGGRLRDRLLPGPSAG